MSRTIHGNLTGRAAFIDLHDQMEQIREQQARERHDLTEKWTTALDQLKAIDPNWEAWFDARPEQKCVDMLPLIEARVKQLQETQIDPSLLIEQATNLQRARMNEIVELERDHASETAFARMGY